MIVEALKGPFITKEPRKRIKYRNIPTNNKIKPEKNFYVFLVEFVVYFLLESLFALPLLCVFLNKKRKEKELDKHIIKC